VCACSYVLCGKIVQHVNIAIDALMNRTFPSPTVSNTVLYFARLQVFLATRVTKRVTLHDVQQERSRISD
jgi:hypothetical protein